MFESAKQQDVKDAQQLNNILRNFVRAVNNIRSAIKTFACLI